MTLQTRHNRRGGFTLIEIIVVLVILAILAAVAIPSMIGYIGQAKASPFVIETRLIYTSAQTMATKYRLEEPEQLMMFFTKPVPSGEVLPGNTGTSNEGPEISRFPNFSSIKRAMYEISSVLSPDLEVGMGPEQYNFVVYINKGIVERVILYYDYDSTTSSYRYQITMETGQEAVIAENTAYGSPDTYGYPGYFFTSIPTSDGKNVVLYYVDMPTP